MSILWAFRQVPMIWGWINVNREQFDGFSALQFPWVGPSTKKFDDLASECLARNIGSLSNKHAPTQAQTLIYLRHTYAPNAADSLSPVWTTLSYYVRRYIHIVCMSYVIQCLYSVAIAKISEQMHTSCGRRAACREPIAIADRVTSRIHHSFVYRNYFQKFTSTF